MRANDSTRRATKRPVRGFLSYAHVDRPLVGRFRELLEPRLAIDRGLELSVWWDDDILVGQPWEDEIRRAIAAVEVGLLLLSPAFLSSEFIGRVEIPLLVRTPGAMVMPVGLQRIDLARSDLQGLDTHQIFRYRDGRYREPRWFADLAGQNPARFCDELAAQITKRLLAAST